MMAVRLRLKELAEARGLNMSQVQRQSGLTMMLVRRYWYNAGKNGPLEAVNLAAIDALSKTLRVQPGDLFEHTPDES